MADKDVAESEVINQEVTNLEPTVAEPQAIEIEGLPEEDLPPPPAGPVTGKFRAKPTKREWIIIAVLAALFAAGGGWYWYQNRSAKVTPQQAAVTPVQQAPVEDLPAPSADDIENKQLIEKFVTPTTGEVWLAERKKITDQGYVINSDAAEYYEVGSKGDKKLIISVTSGIGDDIRLYEKAPNGAVTFVSQPDAVGGYTGDNADYFAQTVAPKIVIDTAIRYDSLTIPKGLELGNGYSIKRPQSPTLGDLIRPDTATMTRVKQYGQSSVMVSERTDTATKLTSIGYFVRTPLNTRVYVEYQLLPTALKDYKWQTGSKTVNDNLRPMTRGCGIYTSVTRADELTDADVQQAGATPTGDKVYEPKSQDYILVTKAFEEFTEFFKDDTSGYKYKGISKTDFLKEHAVLFFKDKNGDWFAFTREELRPQGGCAKPVVYLYPTMPTAVNVKVGADVKISDPLYPADGWDVKAFPNGLLVHKGGIYDSLFWEGPGNGQYPAINAGAVVAREDAVRTIRMQLVQQGLNIKETDDFMAYWESKIPTKPYVRLTWFTTRQLNELAPLHITPRPNTLIRVFLDMEGYDRPIALPSQQLSSVPRVGFTVVEWGGLSALKLY